MLKDNHITAARARTSSSSIASSSGTGGGIKEAVTAARKVGGFSVKIEVEVSTAVEAAEAVEAGADVVMLDNFPMDQVGPVAKGLKEGFPGQGFLVEVSGGVTGRGLEGVDLRGWEGGVDVVSSSSVHQGVEVVDFSLKVV